MELDVTADLIRDLHERGQHSRPRQTGIVLADTGWETRVWADHADTPDQGLIAYTAEDVDILCETGFDDAIAEMLTVPDCNSEATSYRIPDEAGDEAEPQATQDPIVVTGFIDTNDNLVAGFIHAWWFDQATARLVVREQGRLGHGCSAVTSLWQTAGGRWVQRTRQLIRDCRDYWTELTVEQAAGYVYTAESEAVEDRLPTLAAAAWSARILVDLLVSAPGGTRDDNTTAVHTARAISHLVRTQVLSDIREHRAVAAERVAMTFGSERGARSAAAAHLGMSPQTLTNLIGDINE